MDTHFISYGLKLIVTLHDGTKYFYDFDKSKFIKKQISCDLFEKTPNDHWYKIDSCTDSDYRITQKRVYNKIKEMEDKIKKGFFYDNVDDFITSPIKTVEFESSSSSRFSHTPTQKNLNNPMKNLQYAEPI
jgi:hypothetical protein